VFMSPGEAAAAYSASLGITPPFRAGEIVVSDGSALCPCIRGEANSDAWVAMISSQLLLVPVDDDGKPFESSSGEVLKSGSPELADVKERLDAVKKLEDGPTDLPVAPGTHDTDWWWLLIPAVLIMSSGKSDKGEEPTESSE
jgi:hypothetical protein